MKIAILPCSLNKRAMRGPAAQVYSGSLFNLAMAYAERFCDQSYIISLHYGLIRPTDIIEPYDILPRENRRYSGGANYRQYLRQNPEKVNKITKQLNALQGQGTLIYLCARNLAKLGPPGETPLDGLDLIRRKKWLKKELTTCAST